MKHLAPIMLAGTGSDVGKSLIATGLCRIFRQDGFNPAPFKAQNMALNSAATPDGLEIGRAQAVQAEAAGVPCSTDMNPVLLKPTTDLRAQVVVNGRPRGDSDARSYFRNEGRDELRRTVHEAFDRLAARYNPIVMEGAGSISEINLRDRDIVNMPMAAYAGARVILVADIDRGGVFASAYGSVMLQTPADRARIRGIIVNKFRGDLSLFDEGRRMMEEICGVPVLGVVPMAKHIHIDEEDSVSVEAKRRSAAAGMVNVAVVLLPHLSNFTDFDALEHRPGVNLYYAATPADLDGADIVILPGSKNTIGDLLHLRRTGMAAAVLRAHDAGKTVIGICGGYQMLGREVADPDGVEGDVPSVPGLGLLPVSTVLSPGKTTRETEFTFMDDPRSCRGYEIHCGRTESAAPVCRLADGTPDGCMAGERCFGTYLHGLFDNEAVVERVLAMAGRDAGDAFDYAAYRESQFDALADWLREYIDIDLLYKIMSEDD